MELWMRSQTKDRLLKVKNIYLDYDGYHCTKFDLITFDNKTNEITLGTYKSKERALEILDEIHQRLIDLQTLEIAPDSYKTIKRNINCVYEMPEE